VVWAMFAVRFSPPPAAAGWPAGYQAAGR
jgi:hypothetical protein